MKLLLGQHKTNLTWIVRDLVISTRFFNSIYEKHQMSTVWHLKYFSPNQLIPKELQTENMMV